MSLVHKGLGGMDFAGLLGGLLMGLKCAPLMNPGETKNDYDLLVALDHVSDLVHATHGVHGRYAFQFFEFRTCGQPARRS